MELTMHIPGWLLPWGIGFAFGLVVGAIGTLYATFN